MEDFFDIIDWSKTGDALSKLISHFKCQYCRNTLKEPCSFQMCDHYFCKACAMALINQGINCPGCDAVLWREHLQPNLRITEAMKISEQIEKLICKDKVCPVDDMMIVDDEREYGTDVFKGLSKEQCRVSDSGKVAVNDDLVGDQDIDKGQSKNEETNCHVRNLCDCIELDESKVTNNDYEKHTDEFFDNEEIHDGNNSSEPNKELPELFQQNCNHKNELGGINEDIMKSMDDSQITINHKSTILTGIKSKGKGIEKVSSMVTENEESSPSPEKSQFSEAVSDEQYAQGVQRNPKSLVKKPKFTYSKKKTGIIAVKNSKNSLAIPLVTHKVIEHKDEQSSVFDFCSGTITKPISFENHTPSNEELVLVGKNEENINEIINERKRVGKDGSRRTDETKNKKVMNHNDNKENDKEIQKMNGKKPRIRNLEKKNKNGETPLHAACIKGNFEKVKELLQLGAQTNTKDFNGWTPLHEASNHGFNNIVELLLDHDAIIDCVAGEDNDTPLHDAVTNNRVTVAKLLLERGAPLDLKNRLGIYPIGYAYTNEMKNVFKEMNMIDVPEVSYNQLDVSLITDDIPHVLITTNMKPFESVEVKKCCDLLIGKLISDFDPSVTHVICRVDESRVSVSRTLKYLLGVLTGKWVVSFEWINECLLQNKWVPELPYEVKGSPDAQNEIPQKSRINKFKSSPKLFDGCSFYLSGLFKNSLSKETVIDVIKLGGGTILYREPKTSNIDPLIIPLSPEIIKLKLGPKVKTPYVIYHAKETSAQVCCKEYILYDSDLNPNHKKISSPVLCTAPVTWLLDCISYFQILDIKDMYDQEGYKSSQN